MYHRVTLTTLIIMGAPRTKKNSSRILRSRAGKPFLMPSKTFEDYQRDALWQLKRTWGTWPALAVPVEVTALFYRERNTGDLNNYIQALADILEKAKVVVNDRQIKSWDGSRLLIDRAQPRVQVTIRSMDPPEPTPHAE